MGATIQELFLAAAFEGEIDDLKDRVKELETALQAIRRLRNVYQAQL